MKSFRAVPVIAAAAAALVVLPPLLFMGSALFEGMGFGGGSTALAEQYIVKRSNLIVITLLGLVPLLLIMLLLGIRRAIRKTWDGSGTYALAASLPVVAVTIFVHLEYWPSYLPARQFLGFPHGLEFVIGPLIFAPAGILIGFVVAWILRRQVAQ